MIMDMSIYEQYDEFSNEKNGVFRLEFVIGSSFSSRIYNGVFDDKSDRFTVASVLHEMARALEQDISGVPN